MNVAFLPIANLPPPATAVAMALFRPGTGANTGYYRWFDAQGNWGPFSASASLYPFPAKVGAFPADFYTIALADVVMKQADTIIQLVAIDASGHPVSTISVDTVNYYTGR
jgi:hypothetical protein